jgi:hypothetical protein
VRYSALHGTIDGGAVQVRAAHRAVCGILSNPRATGGTATVQVAAFGLWLRTQQGEQVASLSI